MTHAISSNATEPLPGDFARGVFIFAELIMFGVFFLRLIKWELVKRHFMGLGRVRALLRHIMTAYLLTVGGLIAVAYLIA
jgi:heme/copper-type cytochrome/quinol oxidase subunit 3